MIARSSLGSRAISRASRQCTRTPQNPRTSQSCWLTQWPPQTTNHRNRSRPELAGAYTLAPLCSPSLSSGSVNKPRVLAMKFIPTRGGQPQWPSLHNSTWPTLFCHPYRRCDMLYTQAPCADSPLSGTPCIIPMILSTQSTSASVHDNVDIS